MPKEQKNDTYASVYASFAWLVHKEVERYINEHLTEFTEEEMKGGDSTHEEPSNGKQAQTNPN